MTPDEMYRVLELTDHVKKTKGTILGKLNGKAVSHPAKVPYCIYKQASDTVRSGVIIGLGARLQVFQNKLIRQITDRPDTTGETVICLFRHISLRMSWQTLGLSL